jgi:hypothetical protein
LGTLYCYGKGTTKDVDKALEWSPKAADQGLSEAQIFMNFIKQGRCEQEEDDRRTAIENSGTESPMGEYSKIAIAIFIIIEPFILIAFLQQRAALEIGRAFLGDFNPNHLVRSQTWSIAVWIIRLISWCSIGCMSYFGKWYYGLIGIVGSHILSAIVPVPGAFYRTTITRLEKFGVPLNTRIDL